MSDRIQRQHRYTITPEHLILDPEVDDRAFRLWCRLDRYAGDNGAAFPYRETLSVELDCSLSSVDRAIEKLVKAGWLAKERMAAGDRNTYTLLVVPERTVLVRVKKVRAEREAKWAGQRRRKPSDTPTPQENDGGVVMGDDRGGVVTGDERVSSPVTRGVVMGDAHKEASPNEHHGRTNTDAAASADVIDLFGASARSDPEPTFETFYAKYPRKVGRGDAEKAWRQVTKDGAKPTEIMAGLDQYIAEITRKRTAIDYVKHPGPWLRAKRWLDEDSDDSSVTTARTNPNANFDGDDPSGGWGQAALGRN